MSLIGKKSWPNLFILGAPKAGTTSLAEQLGMHQEVFLPALKEPHYYFSGHNTDWYYYKQRLVLTSDLYKELYLKWCEESYAIDGSVHYLGFAEVIAEEILRNVKNPKFIIMIREPIGRIKSHYLMDVRSGLVDRPLVELMRTDNIYSQEYIRSSMYMEKIQVYKRLFGSESICLVDFEDYVSNNSSVMKLIQNFLGVGYVDIPVIKQNEFRMPRKGIKALYKYRALRGVYNSIVPVFLKNILAGMYLSKQKPDVGDFLEPHLLSELTSDYAIARRECVEVYVE